MVVDGDLLSIRDATERFQVSSATLIARLRRGEIPGVKVRGPRNVEWRVSAADLEAAGYSTRLQYEHEHPGTDLRAALKSLQRASRVTPPASSSE